METNNDLQLLKLRTPASQITSGYRLYTGIFRNVFRASWPVAIVYGMAMALMSSYYIGHVIPLMGLSQIVDPDTMQSLWLRTMTIWGATVVFFFAVAAWLASFGFSAMREHQATGAVSRPSHWYGRYDWPTLGGTLMASVWLLLFVVIAGGVATALFMLAARTGLTTLYVAAAVALALLLFMMLPLCYTFYRTLLGPRFSAMPPLKGYLSGLSHVGGIFVVVLVTVIATLLLTLITQLPALILYAANVQSQLGALQGDETGMPPSMSWVSIIVFFVAGFIQAYVHLSTLFPLYYVYGTLTHDENERQHYEKT